MTNKNALAKNLRFLMSNKNVTVRQLARDLGMSSATIVHLSKGRCVPRRATIECLANYFGVAPNLLRFGDVETGEVDVKDFGDNDFITQVHLEHAKPRRMLPLVRASLAYWWFMLDREEKLAQADPDYVKETVTDEEGRPFTSFDDIEERNSVAVPLPITSGRKIELAIAVDNNDLSPMILDGDIVYIEVTTHVKSGDLVVASGDHGKIILGRLSRQNGKTFVKPDYFASFAPAKGDLVEVQDVFGIVAFLFRSLS